MVLAAGFAPALTTLSTSCLFCWTTRANWSLQSVLPRHEFFTKEIRRLLRGGVDWPAESKLDERRLACLSVAPRRRLVAVPSAALGTAGV